MKIKYSIIILLITFFVLSWTPIHAGSFYNSRGLGEIKYVTNAQAIGLGGSLLSVPDQFQINSLNPAGLAFIKITRLSGDFLHEAIWNQTRHDDGFVKYTNLNGISLAIPLKSEKLVTALGLIPASQFDYEYSQLDTIDNYGYSKKIKARGGLNKLSFGFGWAVTKNVYLGNYLHVNFGILERTWTVDYGNDLFWDANNRLTRKMWGMNWTAGLIVRPRASLYIGAIYSTPYHLKYEDQTTNFTQKGSSTYLVDQLQREDEKAQVPAFWGIGATYVLKGKYLFTSDITSQAWSTFENQNDQTSAFNDNYRLGVGVELLPSKNMLAKYHEKMTYRAGYFFQQLDFKDRAGNAVIEHGFSLGAGLPYYGSWGRIDVALRYGQRGNLSSNPVKEDIFQIFISVSGGEKWFMRGN